MPTPVAGSQPVRGNARDQEKFSLVSQSSHAATDRMAPQLKTVVKDYDVEQQLGRGYPGTKNNPIGSNAKKQRCGGSPSKVVDKHDQNSDKEHSESLLRKGWRGLLWLKLKYNTKVYPGNVQGIFPRLLLVALYFSGFSVCVWLINEEVENVQQAYETPTQTIKSESLDTFPAFDIQICAIPKLKLWNPNNKYIFEDTQKWTIDLDTSKAFIFGTPVKVESPAIQHGTDVVGEILGKPVQAERHGLNYSCVVWELSQNENFFKKGTDRSLVLNVNVTGLGSLSEVDLIINPSLEGKFQHDASIVVRESGQDAFSSGSSVTVPHPSIVALGATARIYYYVRKLLMDDENADGHPDRVETQVSFASSITRSATQQGGGEDKFVYSQIQIHPNQQDGLNFHVWVVRESLGAVLSPALAAVLATMTMIFSVFRYIFPRSPLVPVYFRWSTARRYMELQSSQSARRECNLPYPVYSNDMMRQSDLHLERLSDLQRQSDLILQECDFIDLEAGTVEPTGSAHGLHGSLIPAKRVSPVVLKCCLSHKRSLPGKSPLSIYKDSVKAMRRQTVPSPSATGSNPNSGSITDLSPASSDIKEACTQQCNTEDSDLDTPISSPLDRSVLSLRDVMKSESSSPGVQVKNAALGVQGSLLGPCLLRSLDDRVMLSPMHQHKQLESKKRGSGSSVMSVASCDSEREIDRGRMVLP